MSCCLFAHGESTKKMESNEAKRDIQIENSFHTVINSLNFINKFIHIRCYLTRLVFQESQAQPVPVKVINFFMFLLVPAVYNFFYCANKKAFFILINYSPPMSQRKNHFCILSEMSRCCTTKLICINKPQIEVLNTI